MTAILRGALLALVCAFSSPVLADSPVNINEADAQMLSTQLTGVGDARAAAIVEYRDAHGPFERVEDLTAVSGIGESTLEANRDRVVVD